MFNFRPMSMVGSVYKVIAKILSKRLRQVLSDLIGEAHIAFVTSR